MESTGVKNKIHCSSETAELLSVSGRQKWLTPRKNAVSVRGKGVLKTYFLEVISGSRSSVQSNTEESGNSLGVDLGPSANDKTNRLVDWNVEILSGLLKKIVARRQATGKYTQALRKSTTNPSLGSTMVLDEVQEIIALPAFNGSAIRKQVDPDSIQLDKEVVDELFTFVAKVAALYRYDFCWQQRPNHSFGPGT